jgi:leucyl aminopeptidase
MKSTQVVVSKGDIINYAGDLLVCLITVNKKETLNGPDLIQPILNKVKKLDEFNGKKGELFQLYPSFGNDIVKLKCKRLLLIGLGKIDDLNDTAKLSELLRTTGGLIAQQCKKNHAENVCISLQEVLGLKKENIAERLTEGVLLGDYSFSKYKKEEDDKKTYPGLKKLVLITSPKTAAVKKAVERAANCSLSANTARDMANEPGNGWTPSHFARYARRLAKKHTLKCRVLNKKGMIDLGMGGLVAVNQGSKEPPKLIILEYRPETKAETILLVGKGLTFDSGGISLKPASGMMDMKYDMCGGAAVLSAMETIANEKPQVGVVAMIPSTDNLSGSNALKPGDVITHYGGITSEVENTDAEGRLILADSLAYGIEQYKPSCVVDLATLTGAVIIALGHHHTGVLSNNDRLVEQLTDAGAACGEPLWRLPLGEEYSKQIESRVADIKNTGGRPAGSITAAAYLEKFVGDVPWAHLDIAGTAWDFTEKTYIPKGPSGVGVRTLIEFVRCWKNNLQ